MRVCPLTEADLPAAMATSNAAMDGLYGDELPAPTPARQRSQLARRRHPLAHGAGWVAVTPDDEVVGTALASIRDGLFYLAQLGVAPAWQARGVGRALLATAVEYGRTAPRGYILATEDAKALRRYYGAGFRRNRRTIAGYQVGGQAGSLEGGDHGATFSRTR